MPAFAGSLQQYTLVDVLRMIEARQGTGRLHLRYDTLEAVIFLGGGHWLLAERPGESVPLGALLVQVGFLTPALFTHATGVQFEEAATVTDQQTARMLMSARILSRDQLSAWALQDAHDLLEHVSRLPGGEFSFEENIEPPAHRFVVPIPLAHLLPATSMQVPQTPGVYGMPTAPNMSGWDSPSPAGMPPVGMTMPGSARGSIPPMPPGPPMPVSPDALILLPEIDRNITGTIHLTRDQWRVLTMVDGQCTPRAIAVSLQIPEPVVLRTLGELLSNHLIMLG